MIELDLASWNSSNWWPDLMFTSIHSYKFQTFGYHQKWTSEISAPVQISLPSLLAPPQKCEKKSAPTGLNQRNTVFHLFIFLNILKRNAVLGKIKFLF